MAKRIYAKPQVKRVKLNIEEAVLAVCKTVSGGTPKNSTCKTAGTGTCCKDTQGS
jgi:hypothetical protein